MSNVKKIYGYGFDGSPLRTQHEVIRNYFITNPGEGNAISHGSCEDKFGFKRLSALVFDIEKEDMIPINRRKCKVPTRYEGITSEPMFYWVEEKDAQAYLKRQRERKEEQS